MLDAAKEAWLRRLNRYWTARTPRFNTRIGEIYEIDFGENIGAEFSGRHLAICLSNTSPSEESMIVIPITSRYLDYNISTSDLIETQSVNGITIKGGVVLGAARYVSKIRVFKKSLILKEDLDFNTETGVVKGYVEVSSKKLERWKRL